MLLNQASKDVPALFTALCDDAGRLPVSGSSNGKKDRHKGNWTATCLCWLPHHCVRARFNRGTVFHVVPLENNSIGEESMLTGPFSTMNSDARAGSRPRHIQKWTESQSLSAMVYSARFAPYETQNHNVVPKAHATSGQPALPFRVYPCLRVLVRFSASFCSLLNPQKRNKCSTDTVTPVSSFALSPNRCALCQGQLPRSSFCLHQATMQVSGDPVTNLAIPPSRGLDLLSNLERQSMRSVLCQ
jgi:hypothetical protein